jgi:hypothetical protein
MNHKPNKWVVVKVITDKVIYKVFGCWSGSYLGGDSWRMNSGIESIKDTGDAYEFTGYSGSIYICNKNTYGTHGYGAMVLNSMTQEALKNDIITVVLDEDTDFLNLKYE